MKKITKFKNFNRHLRIFILLSIYFSIMIAVGHLKMIISNEYISLGETVLPHAVNYFALFGMVWMIVMGMYYYFALKD